MLIFDRACDTNCRKVEAMNNHMFENQEHLITLRIHNDFQVFLPNEFVEAFNHSLDFTRAAAKERRIMKGCETVHIQ